MQFKFLNNERNYCRLHKLLTEDNTEIIYKELAKRKYGIFIHFKRENYLN